MLDVVVHGGEVIDGTGAPRRRADVAVKDGRVVRIGEVPEEAARAIDAAGKVVAPGFIDVHTHYDAQVFWDGDLTPSPLHGVTTALAGNCGFTIAPLSGDERDGEYLMRMLARVEGMPLESLRSGVPWNWKSTADYFDEIEGRLGINAGFMVGHSALRRVAMGPESVGRPATADEVARIAALLRDALEAGGLGFTSSWARTHNDADGHMVPSRYASREEVLELCRVTGEFEGTSLEFIPMVGAFEPWAMELMAEMSAVAGRPLNWNVLTANAANRAVSLERLGAGDVARARGGKVVALLMPMSMGIRLSFASGFVLDAIPGWEQAMLLPKDKKIELLSSASARRELQEMTRRPDNTMRMVSDWSTKLIFDVVAPENEQYRGRLVGDIAREQGRDPFDVLVDIALADDLKTSFGTLPAPDTREDWEARVELARDRRSVVGASDAGAHLDMIATFNYTTVFLENAVRKFGLLPLEEAVRLMTSEPADLYGLRDRGRLVDGAYADMVVLDPAVVGSEEVGMRFDLPEGAGRLYAGAKGIDHVLVNGTPVVSDGALTGTRTGTLLRSGRDTATAALD
ncbi:MAG TPA: amidohydrolase family protein [Acidimicrobiales bacterium]|nr:amidohydrolase family protein [Acidimicrobiales bacterium]